jgi:23S rRNA (guanosine2251-2'-O)-methyltransferase
MKHDSKEDFRLLLDNIRSVHNVGSIFRTADTLGISQIYCLGTTPVPVDRFGRKRKDFAKVSLGAEDSVKWEHVASANNFLMRLKREGFTIVALEQSSKSVDYKAVKIEGPTLVVMGNEVDGVSRDLVKGADVIAEIPMKGEKESLNVAVAGAVFLYRLLDA